MTRVDVLGVHLTAARYEDAVHNLLEWAARGTSSRAHFCTVHTVVEAHSDARVREALSSSDMVAMDGVPLVWLARRRGSSEAERVCGPDVMLSLCDLGRDLGLRHFFFGGAPGVAESLAAQLSARYPGLAVVGTESPPFRALTPEEDEAGVERINSARPNIVWIGLGSPKQELWAAEHQERLPTSLLLPVGAAFDFHSGRVRRAPRWMQRVGLEWLFRLAANPRRLWRRYTVTNARFVYLLMQARLRGGRTE